MTGLWSSGLILLESSQFGLQLLKFDLRPLEGAERPLLVKPGLPQLFTQLLIRTVKSPDLGFQTHGRVIVASPQVPGYITSVKLEIEEKITLILLFS